MKILLTIFLLVVFSATPALSENNAPPDPNQLPALIPGVRVQGPLDFCGEPLDFDIPGVRERLEKELLLAIWDRPQVVLWIKRFPRYMPLIEKMLKKNGMPDDLKYIAIVESALRPHAGSRKGAIGFWQFIESTGKRPAIAGLFYVMLSMTPV